MVSKCTNVWTSYVNDRKSLVMQIMQCDYTVGEVAELGFETRVA